jgi:hypothetical protein
MPPLVGQPDRDTLAWVGATSQPMNMTVSSVFITMTQDQSLPTIIELAHNNAEQDLRELRIKEQNYVMLLSQVQDKIARVERLRDAAAEYPMQSADPPAAEKAQALASPTPSDSIADAQPRRVQPEHRRTGRGKRILTLMAQGAPDASWTVREVAEGLDEPAKLVRESIEHLHRRGDLTKERAPDRSVRYQLASHAQVHTLRAVGEREAGIA